jgi:hypothetical protein
MSDYNKFRKVIIDLCKQKGACEGEFRKLVSATDMASFNDVLKANFHWCCNNEVLTGDIIDTYGLAEYGIRHNVDASGGYLLASGSATVRAWGSATVRASDSATVEASGSATVRASDSATVEAWGNATVRASDSATVEAWGSATVEAWGSATVRAWSSATVQASGSATVRASGSAYIHAPYGAIECKLSGQAILRHNGVIKSATSEMKLP